MQIRIAILANKDLSKLSKKVAKGYSKLSKSYFWVDGKKFAHHITLFDILPSQKNLRLAEAAVVESLNGKLALKLVVAGAWKSRNGYLGLKLKHTKQLSALRKKLFKDLKLFKPQEVGRKYNAHITLTRYKDSDFPYKIKIKQPIKNSFKFGNIIFAKVDKHGQVYKIIKMFKLKPDKHYRTQ